MKFLLRFTVAIFLPLALPVTIYAQWPTSEYNHLHIRNTSIIEDGEGGFFNVERDGYDKNIQRVDGNGNILWTKEFFTYNYPENRTLENIVLGKDNSIVIVASQYKYPNTNSYIFKLDKNGNHIWDPNGVLVVQYPYFEVTNIVPDDDGSVFLYWNEFPTMGINHLLYAQKLDANGVKQWGEKGLLITPRTGGDTYLGTITKQLIPDGKGGCFLTWSTFRLVPEGTIVSAQHINDKGEFLWGANGKTLATGSSDKTCATVLKNQFNEIFVAWNDNRSQGYRYNLYVQKLDESGNTYLDENGKLVPVVSPVWGGGYGNDNILLGLASDGGFYLTPAHGHPEVIKVGRDGEVNWNTNVGKMTDFSYTMGGPISAAVHGHDIIVGYVEPATDPAGEERNAWKAHVQKLDKDGKRVWANPLRVCSYLPSLDSRISLVGDGQGGAIVAWRDFHGVNKSNPIYHRQYNNAARIFSNGTLGNANVAHPQKPLSIAGPATPCLGAMEYSVPHVDGQTHEWHVFSVVTQNFRYLADGDKTSISFAEPGQYVVFATPVSDAGVNGPPTYAVVDVGAVDLVTGIVGNTILCSGSEQNRYSIDTKPGHTYTWSATGGEVLATAANYIDIKWAAGGTYKVSVTPANQRCGDGSSTSVTVSVTATPELGAINPSGVICFPATSLHSTAAIAGATYYWTVTGGTTSAAAQNNAVNVNWSDSGNQTLKVKARNGDCWGKEIATIVHISVPPAAPSITLGKEAICPGEETYAVAAEGYIAYEWNTTNTNLSIAITSADPVSVRGRDATCWSAFSSPVSVAIHPNPQPTISVEGQELTASDGVSFTWYQDGELYSETTQTITPEVPGDYKVEVTNAFGCTNISGTVRLIVLASEKSSSQTVRVYPNPSLGTFTLEHGGKITALTLRDAMGKDVPFLMRGEQIIDLTELSPGVYLLHISYGNMTELVRLVRM